MCLVVGLGNPGLKYSSTRHNVGFMLLDGLSKNLGVKQVFNKSLNAGVFKHKNTTFIKPQTFMNLSGKAVLSALQQKKSEKIIVIHDDIDLGFGAVRYKYGGSSGGHNGLRSIDDTIGNGYFRVRIGIGRSSTLDVSNYVLQKFSLEEKKELDSILGVAQNGLLELITSDLATTQSLYTLKAFLQ